MTKRFTLYCLFSFWLSSAFLIRATDLPASRSFALARARVVVVDDPRSVVAFNPVAEAIDGMLQKGITTLTAKSTPNEGWRSLVTPSDTVGIKVFSAPGATSGTRPAVAAGVAKALINAGIPASQIVIWDKRLADLRLAGFGEVAERLGVQLAGSADEGYDPKTFYESSLLGTLVWGDMEFGKKGDNLGRRSFVSRLLTRHVTKIINISPLLNHNYAYVSGNLYSLALGSVDNAIRFEAVSSPILQLSESVPEIYALPEVGDRVVLNIVDGLICQYQGEDRMLLHYSTMLHQLRFSTDPVALDVLSIQELDRQRQRARTAAMKINWQMFTNAALLELGISDPRLIDIVRVESGGGN